MKIAKVTLLGLATLMSSTAWAADGSLGATSTGSTALSVTVPDLVRITGITDPIVNVASYSGSGGVDEADDVCIYSNVAGSNTDYDYEITANMEAPSGTARSDFRLCLDATCTNDIPVTVSWNDEDGTNTGEAPLTEGTALTSQTADGANDPDLSGAGNCTASNDNARYHIEIANDDIMAVPAGTYTGTISFVITPIAD